jgi:hypothetical protein
MGFEIAWSSDDLAYVRHRNSSFLLQNFYEPDHAGNFMMVPGERQDHSPGWRVGVGLEAGRDA